MYISLYLLVRRAVRVRGSGRNVLDEALVDAHLEAVPGLGTLTTRGLAGGDLQDLGGEADGALDAERLGLGALNEVGGDYSTDQPLHPQLLVELVAWLLTLLERGDVARSEGDADAVDLGTLAELALLWFVVRHCREKMRKDSVYVESRLLSDDGGRGCTDGRGLW